MAITDFISKVVVQFKGDTSDLKKSLKDLEGAEKEYAEKSIERINQRNDVLDKFNEGLKKAGEIGRAAFEALDGAIERQRVRAAASLANIENLKKASAGLRSETELYEFAAKARSGVLKADNELTEQAVKAMRALTQQGHEYNKVSEVITKALVSGEIEGFKEVGVQVREATTAAEKHAVAKETILKLSKQIREGQQTEAEAAKAAAVAYQDSLDKVKDAFAQLAIALRPLVELATKLVTLAADYLPNITSSVLGGNQAGLQAYADYQAGKISKEEFESRIGKVSLTPTLALGGARETPGGIGKTSVAQDNYLEEALKRQEELDKKLKQKLGEGVDPKPPTAEEKRAWVKAYLAENLTSRGGGNVAAAASVVEASRLLRRQRGEDYRVAGIGELGLGAGGGPYSRLSIGTDEFGRPIDEDALLRRALDRNTRDRLNASWEERLSGRRDGYYNQSDRVGIRGAQRSQLERMFGPLTEFNAYKMAFDALSGSVTSALTAWIDGSKSAGEAFKAFIAEAVKGLAVQMTMEALKHGAYAIGNLAFGDVAGAATHGKAAAAFAAGAVLAAAAAKGLHGGGGNTPGAGSAASVAAGGGSPASANYGYGGAPSYGEEARGEHNVYVVGDPFALDGPRKRAAEFRKTAQRVLGDGGVAFR